MELLNKKFYPKDRILSFHLKKQYFFLHKSKNINMPTNPSFNTKTFDFQHNTSS